MALRHDDAMQLDRLGIENNIDHLAREAPQRFLRPFRENALKVFGDNLVAKLGDDAGEQILLAAEVPIDGHLGHPGAGRHLVHVGAAKTGGEEYRLGPAQNRRALELRLAASASSTCLCPSLGHDGHRLSLANNDTLWYRFNVAGGSVR